MTSRNDPNGRPELERPARYICLAGLGALLAGLVAWLWIGDARLAITGLALFTAALCTVGVLYPGPRRRD
jgi:uncharacterized RDD family membrane protein YckC